MTEVLDRFLRYIKINTQSDEFILDRTPTTDVQWDLARLLEKELKDLGLQDVELNEQCFLTATLPATTDKKLPVIGFLAHIDTSPDFNGEGIKPQIIEHYDGGDIPLKGKAGMVLSPKEFPELSDYVGQTLITTDGTTLLGADDKSGVSEIITAMAYLLGHPEIPHGKIRVAFTPDEETGMGITHFDVDTFGADFAYTLDGGKQGELEFENFNASQATVTVHGKSVHPGDAKGVMINAQLVFMEFNAMLPIEQRPEFTAGREGFFHLLKMSEGSTEEITGIYLIRDHDAKKFDVKEALMRDAADFINRKYGQGTIEVKIKPQYRNMREKLEPVFHVVETAQQALLELGITPINNPIRGGTDGAQLSYMGLPTPNLFTGGHNFHGPYEYANLETMEKAVQVILKIIELYSK
ncbi:tripeptide aminopeptidase [Pelolinea submarina]|uniref:Peptidase T n=2 Tax=Pelolinea submarina TaxID=913107 RepID=A0A347ZP94_9CHLR|nr:peptidase T [Pelolinea submarina]REG08726.1 peptidase T [Pelolinea submarina]BBB47125.1 tripeptide aminopeptidase [Pelolinea submarina]